MAQARRIKPKKTTKKTKKPRKQWNLPWGLMLVILISGVALGVLLSGSQKDGAQFGAGLKELFSKTPPPEGSDQAIVELIEDKGADKTFSFYDMLKDDEQYMPDDLPESKPSRANENKEFYLQAASFVNQADAEKLRASLALKGYRSVTQERASNGVIYHRVRLGPYADKRKAKTAKTKLQKIGVKPFMYSVDKG